MSRVLATGFAVLAVIGCAGENDRAAPIEAAIASADAGAPEQGGPAARILFLGDSLTAGFGLSEQEAFPALVERELVERGWSVAVVNGGVSGDTSAGGVSRLPWLLRQSPDIVVVELGANDGLRGLPIESTAQNLREIVLGSREAGAVVLLVGMRVPPNYGADYADRFAAMFASLAEELGVAYMRFLLEGVGGVAELNLADGIHPNARGHRVVAANVLPHLEELLAALDERKRQ